MVRWLAKQACAFRGHDKSSSSSNCGNFLEMVNFLATMNEDISRVCLDNAPENSKYTSIDIQKEILKILADEVRKKIREEIGSGKFCILVDEALDESNQEQMTIILRFVDYHGIIRESFFDVVGVHDTTALTLKENKTSILTYDLQIENIIGQGYDGASNMRGAWNGLQALLLNECPSIYYVHRFAHRLQLALVVASKDVHDVWLFFSKLNSVVNFVNVSSKHHFELRSAREDEITDRLASGQLESGTRTNQMRSLTRLGATRWSSHYFTVSRVIDMFDSTCKVFENTM
ncbi:hypothetical protein PTKIN_Ptkin13bG0237700 [Pterospermum kingtungense]